MATAGNPGTFAAINDCIARNAAALAAAAPAFATTAATSFHVTVATTTTASETAGRETGRCFGSNATRACPNAIEDATEGSSASNLPASRQRSLVS